MNEPLLEVNHVCRPYDGKLAVDHVTLNVPAGTITALLGPNGSGKSTLFKIIAGLLEPSEGETLLLSHSTRSLTKDMRSQIAVMIDGHQPPNWASPKRLLQLQEEACAEFDRAFAEDLLQRAGIRLTKRFGALSKGQRRWVLTTLALATKAPLLLLDEPADGLDPKARGLLYETLRMLVNEGDRAAMVATHILTDIGAVADDIAILREGRLIMHESLEALREEVCELTLPPGSESLQDDVEYLAKMPDEASRRYLMRRPQAEALLESDVRIQIQPVPLESLYLNLTGSAGEKEEESLILAA